ncbi:hypothetical protein F511_29025 [Dorcoceras hygrometricum]|uniref:Senescence domain-containing protein n=1 Tax=Dorcoceras hygrometricum TaxID=472368 RepID=A0A2Z7CWS1_9LAMI|nr:hypothetical protein F511_29025 [Dorcoceras hygrometricum]
MASQEPNPLYPQLAAKYPESNPTAAPHSSLYPTIDMKDLVENLFPESNDPGTNPYSPSAPPESIEESLITISGAILHLIDRHYSVELAIGDLRILRLLQGSNTVAALASVSDEIHWPLTKDLAAVKLDPSHYFFSFKPPYEAEDSDSSDEEKKENGKKRKDPGNDILNYGLTVVPKGQESLLKELDVILDTYCNFSVQKVVEKTAAMVEVGEVTAGELKLDENKREAVEGQCAAYWTTLAPNVEEYSGTAARLIAAGSGQLIKGVLWCGDVTVDRLKRGNEVLKKRMVSRGKSEIDPNTLKRIKRNETPSSACTRRTDEISTNGFSSLSRPETIFRRRRAAAAAHGGRRRRRIWRGGEAANAFRVRVEMS